MADGVAFTRTMEATRRELRFTPEGMEGLGDGVRAGLAGRGPWAYAQGWFLSPVGLSARTHRGRSARFLTAMLPSESVAWTAKVVAVAQIQAPWLTTEDFPEPWKRTADTN